MEKARERFQDLLILIRTLRGENGCPWDRQQTIETMKKYLHQEFLELMEALEHQASGKTQEEMGDLLFLLLFVAEIARDQGDFTIEDVLAGAKEKMIRRHPHVFDEREAHSISEIRENWVKIKAEEKLLSSRQSLMEKIPRHLSPLLQVFWAVRKAREVAPPWETPVEVIDKAKQKMMCLQERLARDDKEIAEKEVGDLFFMFIYLSRLLNVNPERAIKASLGRFVKRFYSLEEKLQKRGKCPGEASKEEINCLWEEAGHGEIMPKGDGFDSIR